MSSIFLLLQKVHENVYGFPMKLNYSEPEIYTGGVDFNTWTKLSRASQRAALKKSGTCITHLGTLKQVGLLGKLISRLEQTFTLINEVGITF